MLRNKHTFALAWSALCCLSSVALAQSRGTDPTRQALLEQALRARSTGDFATALTLVLRAGEMQWTVSTRRFATEMLLALSRGEEAVTMAETCLREAAISDNRDRETHLRACYELRDNARALVAQRSTPSVQTTPDPSHVTETPHATELTPGSTANSSVVQPQPSELVLVNASRVGPPRTTSFCCSGGLVTVSAGAVTLGVSAGLWAGRNDLLRNCSVDATSILCDTASDVMRAQGAAPLHWASVGLAATGIVLVGAGAVWSIVSAVTRTRAPRASVRITPVWLLEMLGVAGTF